MMNPDASPEPLPRPSLWGRAKRIAGILFRAVDFLMSNEVYTWASAIAFNSLITFFPVIILIHALLRNTGQPELSEHVLFVVRDYLPLSQDFITGTLRSASLKLGHVTWVSSLIVLVSAVGIFVPVEIALNRIWNVERGRHWSVSLGIAYGLTFSLSMIFVVPVVVSWAFGALIRLLLFFLDPGSGVFLLLETAFLRVMAVPVTILVFAICYWVLPARKMSAREVLPAAIFTGVAWELGRYVYRAAVPFLDMKQYYGAFFVSVTLVTFALFSAMLMLFGAYLTSQELLPREIPRWRRKDREGVILTV